MDICLYNPMPCKHDCLDCHEGIPPKKKHKIRKFINFIQMHFEWYDVDNLKRLCHYDYITVKQMNRLIKWRKL